MIYYTIVAKKVLSLRDLYEELRNGLASIFKVKCTSCNKFFKVNTSTEADTITSTRPTYTVNSKIVADKYDKQQFDIKLLSYLCF